MPREEPDNREILLLRSRLKRKSWKRKNNSRSRDNSEIWNQEIKLLLSKRKNA